MIRLVNFELKKLVSKKKVVTIFALLLAASIWLTYVSGKQFTDDLPSTAGISFFQKYPKKRVRSKKMMVHYLTRQ